MRPPRPVAVTGVAGKLGRAVVADLVAHGSPVVGADREPYEDDQVRFHRWDGRDVDGLAEAVTGCSALIHLAAIPVAYRHPHQVVFGNNTLATFSALQAAADAGIRIAVIASSGSAYGTAYAPQVRAPRYVPVDEDHPLDNADPYGLSKEVDERTAAMFCRRYAMSIAALRFHWVTTVDEQRDSVTRTRAGEFDENQLRGLWGFVDLRDAARACRLAVEAAMRKPYGFVPMNIVADDVLADESLAELIARHVPDIEVRSDIDAHGGAYAIDRAERFIGWRPEHTWRSVDS